MKKVYSAFGLISNKGKSPQKAQRSHSTAGIEDDPRIFGVPLLEAIRKTGKYVPFVVEDCIAFLETHALGSEGLFRVPGSASDTQLLKKEYDSGKRPMLAGYSPHTICGLLKLYLRELPDSLLTSSRYEAFVRAQGTGSLEQIKALLRGLPLENRVILQQLLKFLRKVHELRDENRMPSSNLAIVFAPNLMRPAHGDLLRLMEDSKAVNAVVAALIDEYDYFFHETDKESSPSPFSAAGSTQADNGRQKVISHELDAILSETSSLAAETADFLRARAHSHSRVEREIAEQEREDGEEESSSQQAQPLFLKPDNSYARFSGLSRSAEVPHVSIEDVDAEPQETERAAPPSYSPTPSNEEGSEEEDEIIVKRPYIPPRRVFSSGNVPKAISSPSLQPPDPPKRRASEASNVPPPRPKRPDLSPSSPFHSQKHDSEPSVIATTPTLTRTPSGAQVVSTLGSPAPPASSARSNAAGFSISPQAPMVPVSSPLSYSPRGHLGTALSPRDAFTHIGSALSEELAPDSPFNAVSSPIMTMTSSPAEAGTGTTTAGVTVSRSSTSLFSPPSNALSSASTVTAPYQPAFGSPAFYGQSYPLSGQKASPVPSSSSPAQNTSPLRANTTMSLNIHEIDEQESATDKPPERTSPRRRSLQGVQEFVQFKDSHPGSPPRTNPFLTSKSPSAASVLAPSSPSRNNNSPAALDLATYAFSPEHVSHADSPSHGRTVAGAPLSPSFVSSGSSVGSPTPLSRSLSTSRVTGAVPKSPPPSVASPPASIFAASETSKKMHALMQKSVSSLFESNPQLTERYQFIRHASKKDLQDSEAATENVDPQTQPHRNSLRRVGSQPNASARETPVAERIGQTPVSATLSTAFSPAPLLTALSVPSFFGSAATASKPPAGTTANYGRTRRSASTADLNTLIAGFRASLKADTPVPAKVAPRLHTTQPAQETQAREQGPARTERPEERTTGMSPRKQHSPRGQQQQHKTASVARSLRLEGDEEDFTFAQLVPSPAENPRQQQPASAEDAGAPTRPSPRAMRTKEVDEDAGYSITAPFSPAAASRSTTSLASPRRELTREVTNAALKSPRAPSQLSISSPSLTYQQSSSPSSPTVATSSGSPRNSSISVYFPSRSSANLISNSPRSSRDLSQAPSSPRAAASLHSESFAPSGTASSTVLAAALQRLHKERTAVGRPESIIDMTPAQLVDEKEAVKRELKAFDASFYKKNGRMPERQDKEQLRPLYHRYRDIKAILEDHPGAEDDEDDEESDLAPTKKAAAPSPAKAIATARPAEASIRAVAISSSPSHRSSPSHLNSHPPSSPPSTPSSLAAKGKVSSPSSQSKPKPPSHSPPASPPRRAPAPVAARFSHTQSGSPGKRPSALNHTMSNPAVTSPSRVDGVPKSTVAPSVPVRKEPVLLDEASALALLESNNAFLALKGEKKRLQHLLHDYQTEFEKRHGRKVMTKEDRQPVAKQYEQYKAVKAQIDRMVHNCLQEHAKS